jgi:hypothetical protein
MRVVSRGLAWGIVLCATLAHGATSPQHQAARFGALLAELHPDHQHYIRLVRPARSGLVPENLYLGLVRPGGDDPRLLRDAPQPGADHRYDLIVFPDVATLPAVESWARLLVDHEYFHARRLAGADDLPHPAFGTARADRHMHEALAWGYNLQRADSGVYGELEAELRREAEQNYRRHREALKAFILQREPRAWEYYGRLLPER